MATKKIIGVETLSYVSKKTGEAKEAVILYYTGMKSSVIGEYAKDAFIDCDSAIYKNVLAPYEKKLSELVGKEVSIDYTTKGYIDDLSLIN